MEDRIVKLEQVTALIQERNRRVEADKAWETSLLRVSLISVSTYLVAAALLAFMGTRLFLIAALVPAIGYYLSTRSLRAVKERWIQRHSTR